jgi:hypothetical protein
MPRHGCEVKEFPRPQGASFEFVCIDEICRAQKAPVIFESFFDGLRASMHRVSLKKNALQLLARPSGALVVWDNGATQR